MRPHHRLSRLRLTALAAVVVPVAAASIGTGGGPFQARASTGAATGVSRQISISGTGGFAGASASDSNAAAANEEAAPNNDGAVNSDRSDSGRGTSSVGAFAQPHPLTTSTPGLLASFQGLDHFDQRFGSGPGQFSIEPPDQGLCAGSDGAGHARILETLNDVARVFATDGTPVNAPQALNALLHFPPGLIRNPDPGKIIYGPFVTDPACLYDAATGHWFIDVLTLESIPNAGPQGQHFLTGANHIDLAVSNTSDPTGNWTIYSIPVQDDGTQGTPNHHCSPGTPPPPPPPGAPPPPPPSNPTACLGDYPHIGADANGIYITTNEYSFFGNEFHGAQIYAFPKAALAALSATVTMTQFNTQGLDTFGFALNGFTLWPSQTPGGGGDPSAGGTEWFLSSNAAAEAHDTGDGTSTAHPSTQLLVWALTGTQSVGATHPSLVLSTAKLNVGTYAPPPMATQKAGEQPLRDCLNSNPCAAAVLGTDPFAEKSADLDSNDTRMQQVSWVNGRLWGALDTALNVSSHQQAGIEWFDVAPTSSSGSDVASLVNSGYVGLGNDNLTYPAIGMTGAGTGVMGFTLVGSNFYPSAGYATVTSAGVGEVHIAAMGQGPDDGFTDYKFFGNPAGTTRPRWGDYGAAAALGGNVWIASEYIGQSCSFSDFERTNFRCGNTRTLLGNWATRTSEVAAP